MCTFPEKREEIFKIFLYLFAISRIHLSFLKNQFVGVQKEILKNVLLLRWNSPTFESDFNIFFFLPSHQVIVVAPPHENSLKFSPLMMTAPQLSQIKDAQFKVVLSESEWKVKNLFSKKKVVKMFCERVHCSTKVFDSKKCLLKRNTQTMKSFSSNRW